MKVLGKFVMMALSANIFFLGCGNGNGEANSNDTTATTKDVAENINDSALLTKAAEKDAQFAVDAAASSFGEVKLAQLAQKKSSHKEIMEVAKMIEMDHSAALRDLKRMTSSKGIMIPTEESGEAKDKLKELSDEKTSAFDKEWCETLMDNQKNAISKFENAAINVSDPGLKNFVNAVLPKLRTHHDKLMECHKKLK